MRKINQCKIERSNCKKLEYNSQKTNNNQRKFE